MGTLLTLLGLGFAWKLFKMLSEFMKKITTVEGRPYVVETILEKIRPQQEDTPKGVEEYPESEMLDTIGVEGISNYTPPYHPSMDEGDLEIEHLGGGQVGQGGMDTSFIREAIQHDLKKAIILKEILDRKY